MRRSLPLTLILGALWFLSLPVEWAGGPLEDLPDLPPPGPIDPPELDPTTVPPPPANRICGVSVMLALSGGVPGSTPSNTGNPFTSSMVRLLSAAEPVMIKHRIRLISPEKTSPVGEPNSSTSA